MKWTVVIALFSLVFAANCLDKEDFKCVPDVPYKENNCNACTCYGGTILGCSDVDCPTRYDKKYTDCEVGTTWTEDCNKCWCHKDYQTVCTDKKCGPASA